MLVMISFLSSCSKKQDSTEETNANPLSKIDLFFAADGSMSHRGVTQKGAQGEVVRGGALSHFKASDGVTLCFETEKNIAQHPELTKLFAEAPKAGLVYVAKDGIFQATTRTLPQSSLEARD